MRQVVLCIVLLGLRSLYSEPVLLTDDGFVWFSGRCSLVNLKHAAYSAEEISEEIHFLKDGTKASSAKPSIRMYRDSEGRTRFETPVVARQHPETAIGVLVTIEDPVEGYCYVLDPNEPIAYRTDSRTPPKPVTPQRIRVGNQVQQAPQSNSQYRPPQVVEEHLGPSFIEGVEVEGERTTITRDPLATGKAGLFYVHEQWQSRELQLTVLSKTSDGKDEVSTRLTNLSRNEPDATLFRVPANCRIIDQTEEFRLKFR